MPEDPNLLETNARTLVRRWERKAAAYVTPEMLEYHGR